MSSTSIMLMSSLLPDALATLEAAFDVLRYDLATDRDAFLHDHGKDCQGLLIKGHDSFGVQELGHLPNLEIVACSTAGFDAIDADALARAGIPLTNASLALKDDVADTAVMLTLAATRELVRCDAYVRSGDWGRKGPYPLLSSLKGKRAGILGFGVIGQEIAARLKPMRLEIGYCTRSPKDTEFAYFANAAALAEWSDVLFVVVPGGAQTKHLVGLEVLTKLGSKGTLINVARGSVVDEVALIECLSTGKLGAAGLDVFQNEPHTNPALTALSNIVLNPHHASGTVETRAAMAQMAVDNLIAHFESKPLISLANRPVQKTRQSS